MQKDFRPYSDLWVSISEWKNKKKNWLKGDWNKLDADACERWVLKRLRELKSAAKFFKSRNLDEVERICNETYAEIVAF
jgi:hypothetical protein